MLATILLLDGCGGGGAATNEPPLPAPILVGILPASPADYNLPLVYGAAIVGTTVKLYATNTCTGPVVATGSADTFATVGFTVPVANNTTTLFSATSTGSGGKVSECSNALSYVELSVSFDAAVSYPTGGPNSASVVADFDGDGDRDIATVIEAPNGSANPDSAAVLLNDGSGAFGAPTPFVVGVFPSEILVGDYDLDAVPDLAVANNGSGDISVLIGNGDGSFGAPTSYAASPSNRVLAQGDLDGDGDLDLTYPGAALELQVRLGSGTGTFGAGTSQAVGTGANSIAVADFNGDGRLDLLAAQSTIHKVSVLLGDGAGAFGAPVDYAMPAPAWVGAADLNADGRPDMVSAGTGAVYVRLGNGVGGFGASTQYTANTSATKAAIGDLTGDTVPDIVVSGGDGSIAVLVGDGAGRFGAPLTYPMPASCYDPFLADLDGDGRAEIGCTSYSDNVLMVRRNASSGP